MQNVGLYKTHLDILRIIQGKEVTISQIASSLNKSVSWTSLCVNHLRKMDLVLKRKEGLEVYVGPASNELSTSLEVLMFEAPMINPSKVLNKAGLTILPVLLSPGATVAEVSRWKSLSRSSIRNWIREWRGMGVVVREKRTKRYMIPISQKVLRAFIVRYSQWSNRRRVNSLLPNALIVWQWRHEILLSIKTWTAMERFMSAGPTRLEELGYNILHLREYYFYSPQTEEVSEEEALVQALLIDQNNPRMLRYISEGIKKRGANVQAIMGFGRKYGVKTKMLKEVDGLG